MIGYLFFFGCFWLMAMGYGGLDPRWLAESMVEDGIFSGELWVETMSVSSSGNLLAVVAPVSPLVPVAHESVSTVMAEPSLFLESVRTRMHSSTSFLWYQKGQHYRDMEHAFRGQMAWVTASSLSIPTLAQLYPGVPSPLPPLGSGGPSGLVFGALPAGVEFPGQMAGVQASSLSIPTLAQLYPEVPSPLPPLGSGGPSGLVPDALPAGVEAAPSSAWVDFPPPEELDLELKSMIRSALRSSCRN